ASGLHSLRRSGTGHGSSWAAAGDQGADPGYRRPPRSGDDARSRRISARSYPGRVICGARGRPHLQHRGGRAVQSGGARVSAARIVVTPGWAGSRARGRGPRNFPATPTLSHGAAWAPDVEPPAMPPPLIRKEMPDVQLTPDEFKRRYRQRFCDPAFDALAAEIDRLADVAWEAYDDSRKSPRTRPAGSGFADPTYELSVDWIAARQKIDEAEQRQKDPASSPRILLINGATRSEYTCPGETSKTWRLVTLARNAISSEGGFELEILDLSRLASEYGRVIHPCKTCVSTAMPLCHWPCSCYPNHALGQAPDWMNDIYPMWVAAHGIMIVCPVNWYQ